MKVSFPTTQAGLIRFIMLYLMFGLFTSLVAAQTVVYDFTSVANASAAAWQSSGGTVTFNNPIDPLLGDTAVRSNQLEDTTSVSHLFTHPPYSGTAPYWIEGTYSNIAIPATANMVRFEAQVGYESGAQTSTGLIFSVLIQKGSDYFELSKASVKYDTRLNTLSADLTAYKGQTITMKLRLEPGADTNYDWGAWKAAQIVTDGTALFDFVAGTGPSWPNYRFNCAGHGIPWNSPPTSEGGVLQYTGNTEQSGVSCTSALEMVPDTLGGYSNHYATSRYTTGLTIPSTYERVKFIARVGFLSGVSGSNGVTFQFAVNGVVKGSVEALNDGKLDYFTVDLTDYKGQTLTSCDLTVYAGTDAVNDLGVWTEARIVGYSPAVAYDFLADAGKATWSTGWTNPPSNTIPFPGTPNDHGYVLTAIDTMEDSTTHSCIRALGNWNAGAPDYYIQGVYDNVIIPNNWTNVKFTAQVGFLSGAQSSDGVAFQVLVSRRGKVDTLCSVTKTYTGSLATLTANLNGYQGENITIILYIDALGTTTCDWSEWVTPRITAELPMQVYGVDNGMIAGDGNDDLTSFTRTFNKAKAASPCELLLSPGSYNLSTQLSVDSAINLNLKGSVVAGSTTTPTTMLLSDPRAGCIYYLPLCSNLATRNLIIDSRDNGTLPWTQGSVSNVNLTNKTFRFTRTDSTYRDLYSDSLFDTSAPENAGAQYFGTYHESASPYRQPTNTVDSFTITTKTLVSAGVCDVTVDRITGVANGMKVQYARCGKPALYHYSSTGQGQFIYDNITCYAGGDQIAAATGVEKLFVRNCKVKINPATNRIKSNQGDGVHIQNCKQGPDVIDSSFEGMSDDGVNLMTLCYEILWADAAKTNLYIRTSNMPLFVGNHLTLFRDSTGAVGNTVAVLTVADVYYNNEWLKNITVDAVPISDLQVGENGDRFYIEEYASDNFLVTGCTIQNNRGRGILGDASDGLISYNTISYLNGCGIYLVNEPNWTEGLYHNNVTIDHNTINYCGTDYNFILDFHSAIFKVVGRKSDWYPSSAFLNDNIKITYNNVTNWPRHAIYVSSAKNVTIDNNTLTNYYPSGTKAASGRRGIMMFHHIQTSSVTNNTITDQRPKNGSYAMTGKLFLWNDSTGQLTTSNNTYTTNWTGSEITSISSY